MAYIAIGAISPDMSWIVNVRFVALSRRAFVIAPRPLRADCVAKLGGFLPPGWI
ncbi:MAG: hypothetical protein ABSE22_12635 [Xanthobacteraceae bacterium]|jgi:hypothetical protein